MVLQYYIDKILLGILMTIIVSSIAHASPFEPVVDKNAKCYSVVKNVPNRAEKCELQLAFLNDSVTTAIVIYKKQIFRLSNQRICDGEEIDTCYIQNELLEYGQSGKTDQDEYDKLKLEAGQTYLRNESQKRTLVTDELFKPINDKWATCMKSKTHNICIQSKYSIEKIPLLRNEI